MTSPPFENRVQRTLMTMDVVDRIRHRDGQLEALAATGQDDAELHSRLLALYRSQGIEVSAEIIDQGIAALREQRFRYSAPTGPKATLARLWIARRSVAKRLAVAAASITLGTTLVVAWVQKTEDQERKRIAELNAALSRTPSELLHVQAQTDAALSSFNAALTKAEADPHSDRLVAIRARMAKYVRSLLEWPEYKPGKIALVVVRDGDVLLEGTKSKGSWAILGARRDLARRQKALGQMRHVVEEVNSSTQYVQSAIDASAALSKANELALVASLPAEADAVRRREFAFGEQALRGDDLAGARRSVRQIDGLAAGIARAEVIRRRAEQVLADSLATGVAGADRETVQAQFRKVQALAQPPTTDQAERELEALAALATELASDYVLRIVSADGKRSGLWRQSNESPSLRNHYLLVEAIPTNGGDPLKLPIRNEETGATEQVTSFGVRVPEAEYDRVRSDKTDNGIIDKATVGRKARGTLTRQFDVPVAGGYITSW